MGETVETVTDYFWGAPKSLQMVIAAMKLRRLLIERKVMTNLDSILKITDITLPKKVHLVKALPGHFFTELEQKNLKICMKKQLSMKKEILQVIL